MSQSAPQSKLMALPADIHQLIIASFAAPSPLFTPIYDAQKDYPAYGDLVRKHEEFYGQRTDKETASSLALLNCSSVSRFYHNLLSPVILSNVVLRAKPKSVASVQLLANSPTSWQHITSLTFVGTHVTTEPSGSAPNSEQIDPLEDFDYAALSTLLSDLPPNLEQLTLDFPTNWSSEADDDYLDVFDVDESPEDTLELEASNTWRKLIFTVFDAVVKNDLSSKKSFSLKLLNVPPLPCSVYWSSEFHQLLNNITNLTLAFDHFDNGAGWNMNTMEMPVHFCSSLGEWFWNHLVKIQSLSVQADESWPIGLAPGRCHIPLALPNDDVQFRHLTHLSLKWWLVDRQLITLLTKHCPSLTHLTISNYLAHEKDYGSSEAEPTPSWADFFKALQRHPALIHLTLYPHISGRRLLDVFGHNKNQLPEDSADSFRRAWEEVSLLLASKRSLREAGEGKWTAKENARMKRIWPHVSLDDKYGMIFDSEEYNAERFNDGNDQKEWVKLCDVLEERGGGCRVVDVGEEGNEGWLRRIDEDEGVGAA